MRAPRPMRTVLATLGVLAGGLMFAGAPALAAAPETPVSEAAEEIDATTATLHGELNPLTEATTGYEFTYNTNGTCTEGFTTEPGAEAKVEASKVSTPLTGLEPNREYTFCVVATHTPVGEPTESTSGLPVTFRTLTAKPAVGIESAPVVTPFEATLNAEVNPNNQGTPYSFQYSTEATGETLEGSVITVKGASPLSGFGGQSAGVSTGAVLTPATTYYYRVLATNATGTIEGPVEHFTTLTLEKPVVASESFSGLTSTDAKLEAKVNPSYQETSYHFDYSTEATGEVLDGTVTSVEGAPPAPLLTAVSEEQLAGPVDLGGALTPGTIYFYRVVATNPTGTTEGAVQSFQALAKPTVTTGEAQNVTRTTAVLSGTVSPSGAETTYHFAYVDAAEYEPPAANPYAGGGITSGISVGSDHTVHAVGPIQISELQPGVTYHYALVATNSVGTTTGPDATFTTSPPTPPLASTGSADSVSQLAASINGSVDTRGLPTISQFEFGTSPYAGSLQPASITSSSGTVETISTSFNNDLQPGTTFYYRTVATNADGTSYGAEQSFTTGSFLPGFTVPATPAFIPYASIAELDAREVQEGKKTPPKPLTKAQKLAKALTACTKKPKKQRASCKRQARMKYGSSQKKRSSKK